MAKTVIIHICPESGLSIQGMETKERLSSVMSELALRNPMEDSGSLIDWAKALESHRRWLETVVSARLADRQAAEDVLQEVALAAITQTSRPVDPAKVAPWLYRIALRKVINHHRSTGRRKRLLSNAVDAGRGSEHSNAPEPGEWLMMKEDDSEVQQALSQLSTQDRQILLLKYTEGWGYQDLAEHLGITVKTVEYMLLKARRALRAKLSGFTTDS
jgi:RNA polymerase sigma factor (sigma-70 family)